MKFPKNNKNHTIFPKFILFIFMFFALCLSKGEDIHAANIIYNSTNVGSSQVVIKNTTDENAEVQTSSSCFRVRRSNMVTPFINDKATDNTCGIWAKIKLTDASKKYNTGEMANPFTVSFKNAGETIDGRSVDVVIQCTKLSWKLRKISRTKAKYKASNIPSNINSPLNGEQKIQLINLSTSSPLIEHRGCYRSGGPYKDNWTESTKMDLTVIIKDSKTGQAISEEVWCDWRDIDQPDHSVDDVAYNTSGWGETVTALSGQNSTYHVLVPKSQWLLKNSGTAFYSTKADTGNFNSYRSAFIVKGSSITSWRAAGGSCGTYLTFPYTKGGGLRIIKSSTRPEISNTSDYTLQGAEYKLYSNSACTGSPIKTLITDANGKAYTELDIPAGTYYLKETKASKGFKINKNPEQVYISNNNITVKDSGILKETPVEIKYEAPTKEASVKRATIDEEYTYTITKKLNETGEDYIEDQYNSFSITDHLPSQVNYVNAKVVDANGNTLSGWNINHSNRTVTATKDSLATDGSTIKLIITVKVNSTGLDGARKWDNTATCTMDGTEKTSNTVTVKGATPVDAAELPQPTKRTNKGSVSVGESFTYTITQPLSISESDLTGVAYAVFDSADGSLTFFRDASGKYYNNQTSGTKTYYAKFETSTSKTTGAAYWYNNRASIRTIEFKDPCMPLTTSHWFHGMTNVRQIKGLSKLRTDKVVTMNNMFQDLPVSSLNISHFNTSKVTDMSYMFSGCSFLGELDITRFDTSKVTNISHMFSNCSDLESLDLSHFDTTKVTDMSYAFSGLSSITSLEVKYLVTNAVTNMSGMFSGCSSLTTLNARTFKTTNVTNMSYMFENCSSLTEANVQYFDTRKVTDMSYMFYNCSSLITLSPNFPQYPGDANGLFSTSSITDTSSMFYNCTNISTMINILKKPRKYSNMLTNAATASDAYSYLQRGPSVTSSELSALLSTGNGSFRDSGYQAREGVPYSYTPSALVNPPDNYLTSLSFSDALPEGVEYVSGTAEAFNPSGNRVARLGSLSALADNTVSFSHPDIESLGLEANGYINFTLTVRATGAQIEWDNLAQTFAGTTDIPTPIEMSTNIVTVRLKSVAGNYAPHKTTNKSKVLIDEEYTYTISQIVPSKADSGSDYLGKTIKNTTIPADFEEANERSDGKYVLIDNLPDDVEFVSANIVSDGITVQKTTNNGFAEGETYKVVAPTEEGVTSERDATIYGWYDEARHRVSIANTGAEALGCFSNLYLLKLEITVKVKDSAKDSWDNMASALVEDKQLDTEIVTVKQQKTTGTFYPPQKATSKEEVNPGEEYEYIIKCPLNTYDEDWPTETYESFSFKDSLPIEVALEDAEAPSVLVQLCNDNDEVQQIINGTTQYEKQENVISWEPTQNIPLNGGYLKFTVRVITADKVSRNSWPNVATCTINGFELETNEVEVGLKNQIYKPEKTASQSQVSKDSEFTYTITQKLNTGGVDYAGNTPFALTQDDEEWYYSNVSFSDVLPEQVDFISAKGFLNDEEINAPSFDANTRTVSASYDNVPAKGQVLKFEITVKANVEEDEWDNTAKTFLNGYEQESNPVHVESTNNRPQNPQKEASKEKVAFEDEFEYTIIQPINESGEDFTGEHYADSLKITDNLPEEVDFVNVKAYYTNKEGEKVSIAGAHYDEDKHKVTWTDEEEYNGQIPLNGGEISLVIKVIANENALTVSFFDNEAKTAIGENSWNSNVVRVKTVRTYCVETEGWNVDITPPQYDVEEGGSVRVEYSPQDGYRLARIEVDGKEVSLDDFPSAYEFNDIKDNHDIKVYATPINPPKENVIIDFVLVGTGIENAQKIAPSETLLENADIGTLYESPYTPDSPKEIEGYKYKDVASWSAPTKGTVYEHMGHIVYLYEALPPSDPTKATHMLTIHKVDEQSGEGLSGATFTVDGHTLVTDYDGFAKVSLTSGTYTIRETQAPEGYKITNETTEVHLIEDQTVTITNEKMVYVPSTGLKGIMLGLITGLSLLLSSVFILLKRKLG